MVVEKEEDEIEYVSSLSEEDDTSDDNFSTTSSVSGQAPVVRKFN